MTLTSLQPDPRKEKALNKPFSEIFKLDKRNRTVKYLKDSDTISSNTYNQLRASGSLFRMLYGLLKVHNIEVPIRHKKII